VQAWGFDHGERRGEANIPKEELARWTQHPTSISQLVIKGAVSAHSTRDANPPASASPLPFPDSGSGSVSGLSGHPLAGPVEDGADSGDREVGATDPRLLIDLGAIAKGRTVDLAAAALRAHGLTNFIVNAGGNLRAVGTAAGRPWKVAIQNPRGAGALAWLSVQGDESLSTSGDYQRFVTIEGRRYQHILDPRTGWPITGTEAVTVIATNATLADAASTALFVAGRDWPAVARSLGVTQVLRIDDRGQIEATRSLANRLKFTIDSTPAAGPQPTVRIVDL